VSIADRIAGAYPALSPQERRAADFIRTHLGEVAVYSATELAERSGVSKATVSRLFRRLGFSDSTEFRDEARALRAAGVPLALAGAGAAGPGDAARNDGLAVLRARLERERAALDALGPVLGRIPAAAAVVAGAREVLVVGGRSSHPLALHLRGQLAQVRSGVRLAPAPGQALGEELVGLDGSDAVVLVALRRRPAGTAALVDALDGRGVPVVLVADASARGLARRPDLWLECPLDPAGAQDPFDSHAAALVLGTLLASAVLESLPGPGRARATGIADLYARLGEVEE